MALKGFGVISGCSPRYSAGFAGSLRGKFGKPQIRLRRGYGVTGADEANEGGLDGCRIETIDFA
jgi:hypothetical protein